MQAGTLDDTRRAVERVFREEHGRVFAALVRALGAFDVAEDALQEALLVALRVWPERGVPERPAAWLTTVARNAATSSLRHDALARRKLDALAEDAVDVAPEDDIPDDRLRLIVTCCHPALAEEARVALTLSTMCGLSTPAIARLFLVPPATVAQRLVRAKRRIQSTGIGFDVPPAEKLDERLADVLAVVYLLFTEGYDASEGDAAVRGELCDEALRLGRVLCHLVPTHAETRGLYALMLLHDARRAARVDADGELLPIQTQDRSRWSAAQIAEGVAQLDEALARGAPGPYQTQAAIAALHASAPRAEDTDWPQIAALYDVLHRDAPSPSVALAGAVARGMADGPEAGLARLDTLDAEGALDGARRIAAARAELLRRAGRRDEARAAYAAAIAEATQPRVRQFLERRLRELD